MYIGMLRLSKTICGPGSSPTSLPPSPLAKETTSAPILGAFAADESGSASGSMLPPNFSESGNSGGLSPPGNAGDPSVLYVPQCMCPCSGFFGISQFFLDEYRLSCRELRQAIRRDTLEHIQKTADAAEDASTKTVVQRLRLLTGGPKRKSRDPPPLPAVELANGSLAATAEEAKARWLEHFSSIEDGHVKDPVTIVHDCYRRQAGKDLDAYSVSLQDVPDLCSLEGALRDTATDRAYGQDGIPGEVAHYCAAELSKALFQLHLNSIFRLCEPVQHKGGVLHCVWKKKGPKQQCTSYRGILVSSVIGKSLHKLLRQNEVHHSPIHCCLSSAGRGPAPIPRDRPGTCHPPLSVCLPSTRPVPQHRLP